MNHDISIAEAISGFVVLAPLVACIQIVAAVLAYFAKRIWTSFCFTLISLVAAVEYIHFAKGLDTGGSSTAALGLIFYPLIKQSVWAAPLALLVWIASCKGNRQAE